MSGIEGNGVVMFSGVFSSLSFTNTREPFYAFTIGSADTPDVPLSVPGTLALFLASLVGLHVAPRRIMRAVLPARHRLIG